MKYRIYQMKKCRLCFLSYDALMRQTDVFPTDLYRLVYKGALPPMPEVSRKAVLDYLFCTFQNDLGNAPQDFSGRSMSISDVIELLPDTEDGETLCVYVDCFGFKELAKEEFDPEKVPLTSTIRAVIVAPLKAPYAADISCDQHSLQSIVGGPISHKAVVDDSRVTIVFTRQHDGKDIQYNRTFRDSVGNTLDVIFGTFIILGNGISEFESLTPELEKTYLERFARPELMGRTLDGKMVSTVVETVDTFSPMSFKCDALVMNDVIKVYRETTRTITDTRNCVQFDAPFAQWMPKKNGEPLYLTFCIMGRNAVTAEPIWVCLGAQSKGDWHLDIGGSNNE